MKPKQKFIEKYGEHTYIKLRYYLERDLTPTEIATLLKISRLIIVRWREKLKQ